MIPSGASFTVNFTKIAALVLGLMWFDWKVVLVVLLAISDVTMTWTKK